MKKILSVVISLSLILGMVSVSFANENKNVNVQIIDGDEYAVKQIKLSDIPKNIIPIEVNSEADAIDIIEQMSSHIDPVLSEDTHFEKSVLTPHSIMPQAIGTREVSAYKPISSFTVYNPSTGKNQTIGICNFKIYAGLTLDFGTSSAYIKSVDYKDCCLTGYTLGLGLSSTRVTSTVLGNQGLKLVARANLDYYLLVDGLVKLYSKEISHTATWNRV